ncbi:hypothetical protein TNCV_4595131 [Trichonephila clavipes]|uniref:Uncharacterized protein n=1 Tax=Trichonephila clavipes TaxID=2585209 RepID=A0A8X6WGM1_TRICX|nr:hypothetical protein TNCV_4595131 [Trichonephila clavipes]
MPDFNAFYESFFSDRHQEVEDMDWEETPFLPEVSGPFIPSRPPRKMRSLISVQAQTVVVLIYEYQFRDGSRAGQHGLLPGMEYFKGGI